MIKCQLQYLKILCLEFCSFVKPIYIFSCIDISMGDIENWGQRPMFSAAFEEPCKNVNAIKNMFNRLFLWHKFSHSSTKTRKCLGIILQPHHQYFHSLYISIKVLVSGHSQLLWFVKPLASLKQFTVKILFLLFKSYNIRICITIT